MRASLVPLALVPLAPVLFALLATGCESVADSPQARIERFTGCPVPPSAVQLHDHVGGDASAAITHAKVVLPKAELRDFLRGCGTSLGQMEKGYDPTELAPSTELDFWHLPERELLHGGERRQGRRRTVFLLHERDTDIAIYLWARREG